MRSELFSLKAAWKHLISCRKLININVGFAKQVNPKPETRNPEPETRNPEPGTRNPEPGTRNPEPGRLAGEASNLTLKLHQLIAAEEALSGRKSTVTWDNARQRVALY